MGDTLDINFKYTEREYTEAMKWYYFNSVKIKFDILLAIILVVGGIYLLITDGDNIIYIFAVIGGLFFLSIMIFAIFINPSRIFRNEPKFRDEYYLSFSSEKIEFKTDNINSILQWNHYITFKESEHVFYLIYGKNMLTILPKRAFKTKNTEEEFRKLLMSKLKNES